MFDSWRQFLEMVHIFCNVSIALCLATLIYDVILIICGIPNHKGLDAVSNTKVPSKTRFAVLCSARNEEKVIAYLIRSIKAMDYPKELFEVFIIADNCTDRTAEVARAEGATVLERFDTSRATKGYALNWFFQQKLDDLLKRFDHCVVFDADNLVDDQFLTYMDRHVQSGQRAMVGYRDSKNPEESVIAGANSLFWMNQSRFLHNARNHLDLSATSVSGTGFSFDLKLIRNSGWQTHTITEDVEFAMQIILKGERVVYVRQAVYYDEQVSDFKQMIRQRFRWSVGPVQVMRLMAQPLFNKALKVDFKVFDAFWFLARIPFFLFVTIVSIIRFLIRVTDPAFHLSMLAGDLIFPLVAYIGTVLLMAFLVKLEGKSLKVYGRAVLAFPILGLIWGGMQIIALFFKDAEWHPIEHVRGVEIKSLKK